MGDLKCTLKSTTESTESMIESSIIYYPEKCPNL